MNWARMAFLAGVLAAGTVRLAAAEGWSWRDWVPFAKSEKSTGVKQASPTRAPKFSSGSLKGSTSRRSTANDSPLERMTAGTRRFFSSATDRLTFRRSKPATKREPVSGQSGTYSVRKPKEERKKSIFTSWFGGDDPPAPPETAQEWQALERPMP